MVGVCDMPLQNLLTGESLMVRPLAPTTIGFIIYVARSSHYANAYNAPTGTREQYIQPKALTGSTGQRIQSKPSTGSDVCGDVGV